MKPPSRHTTGGDTPQHAGWATRSTCRAWLCIAAPGEGNDVAAFKLQTRRGLTRLREILEAAGTDFQHVAMINSFHVWQGPNFAGSRDEQFAAFEAVIDEFMKPPYPAWTAVGTTGLSGERQHRRSAAHREGALKQV